MIPCSICGGSPCREGCSPTYRERRAARAERLRGWAAKRQISATATLVADRATYGGNIAFNTQPGHIPERARMIARTDRALNSLATAQRMEARAASIEAQAKSAIYSDDPDAIEALRERIASLEAERERIKAYNASARKGRPDPSILDEAQRDSLALVQRVGSLRADGSFPAYATTNLGGNIARNRERLARLERQA